MENATLGGGPAPLNAILPPPVALRQRYRAPPITGKGDPRTFKVFLYDQGITQVFIVAAYSRQQAAELLECAELYLKQFGKPPSDDERERAERTPGQVWVSAIGGPPSYRKWMHQKGTVWG